jgi:hypothetical protein
MTSSPSTKAWRTILIVIAGLGLLAIFVLPALSRARAYSGPGVQGNLLTLEVAKARWMDEHPGGSEWPTKQDLLPYLTNGTRLISFDQVNRPRNGEIYIINKTGAQVCAYDPKSERPFTVDSNQLQMIQQMK